MKKLLSREPTPEMLTAAGPMRGYDIHAANASPDADHVEWWRAMWDAAPALPEPGEVEKRLRFMDNFAAEEAADLIAALQQRLKMHEPVSKFDGLSIDEWKERAEKAEADRERMFHQLQHWWKRVADLEAENERLRNLIKSMGTGFDDAAIDAARKP